MSAPTANSSRRHGLAAVPSTQPLRALALALAVGLGGLSVPLAANAGLVQGSDPDGYRTGEFRLQLGAGELVFTGSADYNFPSFDYRSTVATGAGTELIFGAPLAANTLIDANNSYSTGSETLFDRWQSGYMVNLPGGRSCSRWSCWSYPSISYGVVTGAGLDGAWAGDSTGLLGFRFQDKGWHYGWVELTVDDDSFDIGRWAYQNVAGVGIAAGSTEAPAPMLLLSEPAPIPAPALIPVPVPIVESIPTPAPIPTAAPAPAAVPEPSALALLALGAAGMTAFRRRRA